MVLKKLNLTEQKQKCDNKPKYITTQNKQEPATAAMADRGVVKAVNFLWM